MIDLALAFMAAVIGVVGVLVWGRNLYWADNWLERLACGVIAAGVFTASMLLVAELVFRVIGGKAS